jgi:hypothetical protein
MTFMPYTRHSESYTSGNITGNNTTASTGNITNIELKVLSHKPILRKVCKQARPQLGLSPSDLQKAIRDVIRRKHENLRSLTL